MSKGRLALGVTLVLIIALSPLLSQLPALLSRSITTQAQVQENAMDFLLNEAIRELTTAGLSPGLYEQALDDKLLTGLFPNNFVIFSSGIAEAATLFQATLANTARADQALGVFINTNTEAVLLQRAQQLRTFLRATGEELATTDNFLNTAGPEGRLCSPATIDPATNQERPATKDEIAARCPRVALQDPELAEAEHGSHLFEREVRRPFTWWYWPLLRTPQEAVFVTGPLDPGQCAAIVKEVKGLKVIVRPIIIPWWSESWNPPRGFVTFRVVWVWEWVPAEFIKEINICNIGKTTTVTTTNSKTTFTTTTTTTTIKTTTTTTAAGTIVKTVTMRIVREWPLEFFWWFFPKDP